MVNDYGIIAWIVQNNIKTEKGTAFDFKNHFYLYDIYSDWSPKQVGYKAAQIGWSTMAILKSAYAVKHKKLDAVYTLPTIGDVYDFVGGKVNRIISANPILQKYTEDRDTMEQKRFGENVLYYRGTATEKEALMVSSDLNIHDEEDRSTQSSISQYASRLQHSKLQWEWHFSNPSVEGNGVSKYWPLSDQKHWFIKCGHCGYEQYLSWPDSVDIDNKIYVCKKCRQELSNEDRRVGRWVQKYLNKEFSGYWVSLLMTPWTSASKIIELYNTKSKDYFWNFVLGLPYVGEGNKVSPDIIFRNLSVKLNSYKDVVIGVDSGIEKHFVCGNQEGLFYYGKTERWEDIESLLNRFEGSIAVIDAMPDITGPRMLQEKYPGRVFLCHFARDRKTQQIIRWGQNEEHGNVLADRNRAIQMTIDEFADKRIRLSGSRDDWGEFYAHWDSLYRITENDSLGVPHINWQSSNGIDHFAFATIYWRIGMDKYGFGKGEIIGAPPIIEAPVGPGLKPDMTIQPVNIRGRDPVEETLEQLKNQQTEDWRDF